jgi:hypothetical protein
MIPTTASAYRLAFFLNIAALLPSGSAAEVTISFTGGQFYDATGATPLPNLSLVLLVADTQNNGFGDLTAGTLNVGDFLNGTDDRILFRAAVNTALGGSAVQDTLTNATLTGSWNQGDALALVWFSGLTSGSFSFTSGQSYGRFTTSSALSGDPWITPGDGGAITLSFVTSSLGGSYGDALGRASLTAIPEPATFATWVGALAAGAMAWRRKKNSCQLPPQPGEPLLQIRP